MSDIKKCPKCSYNGYLSDWADEWRYDILPNTKFSIGCGNVECVNYVVDVEKTFDKREDAIEWWNETIRNKYKFKRT